MKTFLYPALLVLIFFSFITAPSSSASQHGTGGVEVIYPFFFGSAPGYGGGAKTGPYYGGRPWPYSPRLEGEVRVEVEEIEDGVLIRLTSEDEKTKKELRLMGRMMKLINDLKELEAEGR